MAGLRKYSSVFIAGVIGVIVGLIIGQMIQRSVKIPDATSKNDQMAAFSSATASIEGEITAIYGDQIKIRSLNGREGSFPMAKEVQVYSLRPGEKQATSSSIVDQTILNQRVLLGLNYQNGQFEVVSVSRIPAQQNSNLQRQ